MVAQALKSQPTYLPKMKQTLYNFGYIHGLTSQQVDEISKKLGHAEYTIQCDQATRAYIRKNYKASIKNLGRFYGKFPESDE